MQRMIILVLYIFRINIFLSAALRLQFGVLSIIYMSFVLNYSYAYESIIHLILHKLGVGGCILKSVCNIYFKRNPIALIYYIIFQNFLLQVPKGFKEYTV